MDNHNTKILNYIYQNAEMGVSSISKLLECVEDEKFDQALSGQLGRYRMFMAEAQEALSQRGGELKHIPKTSELMSKVMINIKTIRDCSPPKLAEMMLQGTTMGIINGTKVIKHNKQADEDIIALAQRLLDYEETQYHKLLKFL